MRIAVLLAVVWAGLAVGARADTLRVTNDAQFRAALVAARQGGTITVADGTYAGGLQFRNHGNPGAQVITIKAEHDGKAVIDGGNQGLELYQSNWVSIEGLVFQHATACGLRVLAGKHVSVKRCIARDNGQIGVACGSAPDFLVEDCLISGSRGQHGCYIADNSQRAIFRRNKVWDCGRAGMQTNSQSGFMDACVIEDNEIWQCGDGRADGGNTQAAGLNLAALRNSTIRRNNIHDNYAGGIALFLGATGNTLSSNTVMFGYGIGRQCIFSSGETTNEVSGNICVGGRRGAGPPIQAYSPATFTGSGNKVSFAVPTVGAGQ